jgi:hypothetical protein
MVVGKSAVTMQFMKFIEDLFNVIQRIRAQGMPAQLGDLPGRQVPENPPDFMPHFDLEPVNFFVEIDRVIGTDIAQFIDFGLQFGDRLFEIKVIGNHCFARWIRITL